ncbi:leucine-rich repeat domain-containing protein [Cohnella abietis]|uniref:BIG2 domain-containing protein n=1 Tax=Cohnella abietis TaxID=2507935 RepID=A0A3T1CY20_9BACL|nr:leucine-rich repeat domain-containing protein [Cohnella abietis]BBI30762.1 hypothetical protein KCTCHS21_01610 [Cohnella abietis]
MKKFNHISLILAALLVFQMLPLFMGKAAAANPEAIFPDANLDQAIHDWLEIPVGSPIYKSDLEIKLNSLSGIDKGLPYELWNKNISSLEGMEMFKGLDFRVLNLAGNNITDLSPIAGLMTLENLDLLSDAGPGSNNVSDLSPLRGLTNMRFLNLSNNAVSELEPLSGLTGMWSLNISGNNVSSVSPLSGMNQLFYLDISRNQISDISNFLAFTAMRNLYVGNNQISDISSLSELMQLQSLALQNNRISSISPLSGLTNLTHLVFSNNQVSNIVPLSGLTNLQDLQFSYNQINDITPVSGLSNLKNFVASNNEITDPSPISGFSNLYILDLKGNIITDITSLNGLTSLTYADISYNFIDLFSGENQSIANALPAGSSIEPQQKMFPLSSVTNTIKVSTGATIKPGYINYLTSDGSTFPFTFSDPKGTTFSSANNNIATINSSGVITGVSEGTTQITAFNYGIDAPFTKITLNVQVDPAVVTLQSIIISPATATVQVGETKQYKATANFSDESTQDITNTAVWSLSDSMKASINSSGLTTGITSGSTNVTATWNNLNSTVILVVKALPSVPTPEPTPESTPTLDPPTVPTLDTAPGPTPGPTATPAPTPEESPEPPLPTPEPTPIVLKQILLTPKLAKVQVGATTKFKAIAIYSDNSTQDITAKGSWVVLDRIAHILNGVVTGDKVGSTKISIHWEGQTAVAHLLVEKQNETQSSVNQNTNKPIPPVNPIKPIISVIPRKPISIKVDKESSVEDIVTIYGRIHGVVRDSNGNPLVGVQVKLQSIVQNTITNENGEYAFYKVELGEHSLILLDANSLEKIGKIKIVVDNGVESHGKSAVSLELTQDNPELIVNVIVTPNADPAPTVDPLTPIDDKPTSTNDETNQSINPIILGAVLFTFVVLVIFWLRRKNVFVYEMHNMPGQEKLILLKKMKIKPTNETVIDIPDVLANHTLLVVIKKRLTNKLLHKNIAITTGTKTINIKVEPEMLNQDIKLGIN